MPFKIPNPPPGMMNKGADTAIRSVLWMLTVFGSGAAAAAGLIFLFGGGEARANNTTPAEVAQLAAKVEKLDDRVREVQLDIADIKARIPERHR